MASKITMVAVLAILSIVVHHASSLRLDNGRPEKEPRLIVAPTLGGLILKGAKVGLYFVKKVWSLIGFKLGAIALIANLVIWGLKHSFTIILGAAGMFGFCKLTSKCSIDNIPKPVLDVGDTLLYAARQLQNGADLYEANEIAYY